VILPSIPADEAQRQAKLDGLAILDTPGEPAFSNIARLAAHVCGTPVALVSLVDRQRQWFKAKVGVAISETPREHSFCGHAIAADQPLIVPDALADPRFRDNPLVTAEPTIRFYAGVPLRLGPGSALGTLCVIDRVPRQLSSAQIDALRLLADQVMTELRLRDELKQRPAGPLGDESAPIPLPLYERETVPGVSRAPASHVVLTPGVEPVRPGARLEDRYQIDEVIGRGSMGFVFAARDLRADRPVAIKFLRRPPLGGEDAVERFAREARAVMKLKSERVPRIFDVGNTDDGVPYIVMERLQGEELGAAIARGPLPAGPAIDIVLQSCEVLGEAHDAGIVHRDIKPANLFITREGMLKVLDFGIAKFLSGAPDGAATLAFTMLGSPYYMAPEQVVGDRDIDGRADLWSLGVVLHEMLTGEVPFRGQSLKDVCHAVLHDEPAISAGALGAVIARCLRKNPRDRYASAWELARDLAPLR
jgi:predicted Ser/Thr protein kinase